MARPPEGVALLVAGHGADGATIDASMVHTLGQIGEALLATGARWQIRRLRAAVGERLGADRSSLKRQLDELVREEVRVAMVVMLGAIVELPAGPALVAGTDHRDYPEDAALPLAWIGKRLRSARADRLLVVVSATTEEPGTVAARWLGLLATGRAGDVVAVDAPPAGCPLADALLGGLCGSALDPTTGTVTFKSISEHLRRNAPRSALQISHASETVAASPPLAGLWDVRRSQLSAMPRSHAVGELEDLTGTVLPGRFRIDHVVARGTFGTVYRARQLAVERDVAVKVLHANIDPASEDGRLFVHEIRSVGRIDHTNVVRIHQADITHDGRLFFAMELLDGRDLQQLAADGPVPRARTIELVRELLAGLAAAHDAGLVHADIKPANALVVPRRGAKGEPGERVVLVDFGLARLRTPDRPADSAGGTPAFMAPEQLHDGRVDARSDLFSVGLVLVFLLTGWRRTNAHTMVPPADTVTDPELREVLARALAMDPAKRFQTAGEFAAALDGKVAEPAEPASGPRVPFRHLEPLTERDRDRFHGREHEVAVLTDHVLYGRSVIYTAPSGTGKTSLLRAGLVPRLEALGITVVYHRCRSEPIERLAGAITAGATSIAEAIAQHHDQRGGKLVLVLDQLEAALADGGPDLVRAVLDVDATIVLSIREDHLARLVARTQQLQPTMPIVRLPPLRPEGARTAIVNPLLEARLAIDAELTTLLLDDLRRAAAKLGPEMGWGTEPAVYPPHLQLVCSVLYETLAPGEATLTVAHYRQLGGFDAIVGEYLERVLDTELADGRDVIARDLFVALVTATHERASRTEAELVEVVGGRHPADEVVAVLEILRARVLLVRVRTGGDDARWELVHDSLVPRVLAWIDRKDLARRRAVELVRYHVRRSRPATPSLLGRAELREIRPHAAAIAELDDDFRKRERDVHWTPQRLVGRSRQLLRRKTLTTAGILAAAASIASIGLYRSSAAQAREAHERNLRDLDLGSFTLILEPFDWDPKTLTASPVPRAALPDLRWELRYPATADPEQPGEPFRPEHLVREGDHVEAHGGRAFLVVSGRGRAGAHCSPSIVPLRDLPGYVQRTQQLALHIRIPTCDATRVDMIQIPRGPFVFGGLGEPPSSYLEENPADRIPERRVELAAFAIDRTEVSNAAFELIAGMAELTGIHRPTYPHIPMLDTAGEPARPVSGLTWFEARAFCQFFGKRLPTSQQWQKALRGGDEIEGQPNPVPKRNLPWGAVVLPVPANIHDRAEPTSRPVGSSPGDRSPYGVLDLAGNVQEWTDTLTDAREDGTRVTRGANFDDTTLELLVDYLAIENQKPTLTRIYALGARCALE